MTNHVFENFEDVEENIRQTAPKVVYKYRSDWNNLYQREFIIKQSMWFAAPRDLNDPYDIRTPVRFDPKEIEHPVFFQKLKHYLQSNNPQIGFTERDLNIICENKLEEIRRDPIKYFENTYRQIRESEIFDRIGLFSCTTDELNETMWAHYGNNHSGFAVGFQTVELSRNLYCSIGPVKYSDEVPLHSFIESKQEGDFDIYFLKSKKWEYEKEFRFFILGDDAKIERKKIYPKESVFEFLLGSRFPERFLKDFIFEIRKLYSKDIPIYKVTPKMSGFGLEKVRID